MPHRKCSGRTWLRNGGLLGTSYFLLPRTLHDERTLNAWEVLFEGGTPGSVLGTGYTLVFGAKELEGLRFKHLADRRTSGQGDICDGK